MFYFEKCYDLDELAKHSMHIHTHFSNCAKAEMQLPAILAECRRVGITHIALVDHSNIEADGNPTPVAEHNKILKAELAELNPDISVRVGCELSLYGVGKLSDTPENIRSFEYTLISQNHYHMPFWEQPESKTPRGYAEHMLACLSWLFTTDYADCIAHPLVPIKIKNFPRANEIPNTITDNELGDILSAGEAAGCAWELHWGAVLCWPDFARRYFNIGREVGVHFNYATDAHQIANIDTHQILPQFKQILL